MRAILTAVIMMAIAATTPAPDLVALAKGGRRPTFAMVADARFDAAGDARFAAFQKWATEISQEDRARFFEALSPGPDGKQRWREKVPCSLDDARGEYRAMTIAAKAPDRASAEATWKEVERTYTNGGALEQKMLTEAQASLAKRPTPLGRQLALRIPADQAWRDAISDRAHDELTSSAIATRIFDGKLCRIDHDDTQFLKAVVATEGWPTISRDGVDATNDAWLLAQHADAEPDFQKQVLDLMEPLVARKEVRAKDYALLFDRVAIAAHRPQRYGTQFGEGKGGCLAVSPVEDHAGIDARRQAVGLGTLADYGKQISGAYHQKICADIFDTANP